MQLTFLSKKAHTFIFFNCLLDSDLHQVQLAWLPVMLHIAVQWTKDTTEWFRTQYTGVRD